MSKKDGSCLAGSVANSFIRRISSERGVGDTFPYGVLLSFFTTVLGALSCELRWEMRDLWKKKLISVNFKSL